MNRLNMNKDRNWDAQHYKKHSQSQTKRGLSVIRSYPFVGDENVLDVGCGDGRITAEIATKVPLGYVLGIDVSQNMIDEARKNFGFTENLEFQCIDATKFENNEMFDLVVSFAALHWIADQLSVLKKLHASLRSGGPMYMIMAFDYRSPISDVFKSEKWRDALSKREPVFFGQTVDGLRGLLSMAGFEEIEVKVVDFSREFEDKKDLFNAMFAWVPSATGLSKDRAKEFTWDIVESICSANKKDKIVWGTKSLHASAKKG